MSTKNKEHDELDTINDALSNSEQYLERNRRIIITAVIAVIVIITSLLAIRHFYILPNRVEAENALFPGTFYFEQDSFAVALNGNGADFIGFAAVANQYSSTPAGNLAKAYAGLSLLHMQQYDAAISYLKEVDLDDNLVGPAVIGAIGDCLVNTDKYEEALSYFEKAAKKGDNPLIAPIYLKKAGLVAEKLGKYDNAKERYTEIKDKYPTSAEARDIEKYIDRAAAKK